MGCITAWSGSVDGKEFSDSLSFVGSMLFWVNKPIVGLCLSGQFNILSTNHIKENSNVEWKICQPIAITYNTQQQPLP